MLCFYACSNVTAFVQKFHLLQSEFVLYVQCGLLSRVLNYTSIQLQRTGWAIYERYRKPFSVAPLFSSSSSSFLLRPSRCSFMPYNSTIEKPAQEVVIAYEKRYVGPQADGQTYLQGTH